MFVTLPRLMLMACLLCPTLSWALGLGEIHLNSALNEPMNAEIDLIAAGPDELGALRAALAPKDAFTRYGMIVRRSCRRSRSRWARARMAATYYWCGRLNRFPNLLSRSWLK